jgi:hypothetical protein
VVYVAVYFPQPESQTGAVATGGPPYGEGLGTEGIPMALWGLIVAGGLVIGSIPAFLGLILVMPVLGHATWHLYRKVVP